MSSDFVRRSLKATTIGLSPTTTARSSTMSIRTPGQGLDPVPAKAQLVPGRSDVVSGDRARAVFGQVMGLVALTVGCMALGAYIGRDLNGGIGIAFFAAGIACIVGLNIASRRGHEQLSTTFLFGLGLLIGLALGPVLNAYAHTDPSALWQAAGATGAFVAALGAIGYATRRDLSSWARTLFWALLALIVFGIVAIFVSIPHAHLIWAVAGLAIFGAFTIFDFNRLRRAGTESAVRIAASIFLDILNVFLFFLQIFGGGRD
jgi:FtsH-binding integral membrane protein